MVISQGHYGTCYTYNNYSNTTTSADSFDDYTITSCSYKINDILEQKILWNSSSDDSNLYYWDSATNSTGEMSRWIIEEKLLKGGYRLQSPQDRLREILRSRHAPAVHVARKVLEPTESPKEARARETLRQFIGEDRYRQFLRSGFVTIRAASGRTYQIFPGNKITNVYYDGKLVDRLCVVLRGSFPPTDSIIMRFLLILNDEKEFCEIGVKQSIYRESPVRREIDSRSLPEIFRELKRHAA